MRLVLQLVARLFLIVVLCLGAATIWATFDAYRSVDRATAGTVVATPDETAAISLAWEYILNVIDVALLMAAAIALLASLAIAHALAPARTIVTALQRMARGQYRTKLPRFRSMELAMIG